MTMKLLQAVSLFCLHLFVRSFADSPKNVGDNETAAAQNDGHIIQSLFRFPASQLGSGFNELLNIWYDEWLHTTSNSTVPSILPPIIPDTSAAEHASNAVSATAATLFRRQCYRPLSSTQQTLYKNLEHRRKEIEFQYLNDAKEEMKLLHTMVKRFSPAFDQDEVGTAKNSAHAHKKKTKSTVNTIYSLPTSVIATYDSPAKLAYQSDNVGGNDTQQWSWQPAGHFSARGTSDNYRFRIDFFNAMRQKLKDVPLEMGRQSGLFWYPPGSVREWHSNYLDLVGSTKINKSKRDERDKEIFGNQVWRMYFVRTVRDESFDAKLRKLNRKQPSLAGNDTLLDTSTNDHSAMHIIPGDDDGLTLEVLQNAGARKLTSEENIRQYSDIFADDDDPKHGRSKTPADASDTLFDRNAVWRIPDQDGYLTLFRLPKLWHCIVSEEVHRYSLGFAFSDKEVQGLLRMAGVDFDVKHEHVNCASEECIRATDEL